MARETQMTPTAIYHGYRILLASLLLYIAGQYSTFSTNHLTHNFMLVCVGYLPLAILIPLLPSRFLVVGFIIDVAATILLIHTSGGLADSFAVLMLVVVASANILMSMRLGLFIAALATLTILGEQAWLSLTPGVQINFSGVGLLGLAFFATSLLVQQLSMRLERSEALTIKQRQAISQLEELNRQIVSRLRTGIIVFDRYRQVLTANPTAQQLFNAPLAGNPLPEQLSHSYNEWLQQPHNYRPSLKISSQMPAMLARFAKLDENDQHSQTVLFLEDESRLTQEAQHLKLASLGRMSAIIAHEIRNPLSAIQHATDLLAEEVETEDNEPLFNIVRNHVKRVNGIISGILNLSRRPEGRSEQLHLATEVQKALDQLRQQGVDCRPIHIDSIDDDLHIRFIAEQLQQLIQNLITNAFLHGGDKVEITLTAGRHSRSRLPWLCIADNGKGISAEARKHLFEPFFTTSRSGNGLGLFVCRELCEANQAQLLLEDDDPANPGAHFVITFAHPDRLF